MKLFCSMRHPPKKDGQWPLMSTCHQPVTLSWFFRMISDLMVFFCEGTFAKDRLHRGGCHITVLRTFDNGCWKSHQAEFQHSGLSCTSRLIAPTLNSVQTLVVLLRHSLSPFKKGTTKTGILIFRKYQLWNFSSPWASGGSMKHCRKSWLRIFQTGGP